MTAIVVGGQLIDGKSMKNVTDDRMKKLTAIKFNELPLERAIKHVRGDGKRLLATFEDPNCGYCKRLAKDLLKLDNVTIYTFLYPILSEDSVRKSKQIWCSADRAKSWNDWMVDGKAPSGRDDCDTAAVGKNQEFGRKLNITGTPTMFLQTVSGFQGLWRWIVSSKSLISQNNPKLGSCSKGSQGCPLSFWRGMPRELAEPCHWFVRG